MVKSFHYFYYISLLAFSLPPPPTLPKSIGVLEVSKPSFTLSSLFLVLFSLSSFFYFHNIQYLCSSPPRNLSKLSEFCNLPISLCVKFIVFQLVGLSNGRSFFHFVISLSPFSSPPPPPEICRSCPEFSNIAIAFCLKYIVSIFFIYRSSRSSRSCRSFFKYM